VNFDEGERNVGMHEIICPHCAKAFKIDEAGYANILKQVRDSEFEQQLHERLELAELDKRNAVELATTRVASDLQKASAAKDSEIQELKAKVDAGEVVRKLAINEALSTVEKERDTLANELEQARRERESAAKLAEANLLNELQKAAAAKDAAIQELTSKLSAIEVAQKLAISEAVGKVEKERDEFRSGLERAELEKLLAEKSLKDKYETQIKDRDDAIERLPDSLGSLIDKMTSFRQGEALLVGESIILPSIVQIDPCSDAPSSNDIPYWQLWKEEWKAMDFAAIKAEWYK